MRIPDLDSVGERLAALATIVTLIYLALQIRQNTSQQQGEAMIEINTAERHLVDELRADPSLVCALANATRSTTGTRFRFQTRSGSIFICVPKRDGAKPAGSCGRRVRSTGRPMHRAET